VQELRKILAGFSQAGIRAIPFKGPVLAYHGYGNLSLRKSGDLDLLIPIQDLPPARQWLVTAGYQVETPLRADGLPCQPDKYEIRGVHPDGGVVELRWRLLRQHYSASLGFDRIWERCRPFDMAGLRVPLLADEDLFLILCIHGAKHFWDRLMWICDLAELARVRPDLDWQSLQRQARALGCERTLALGCLLAVELLGAPLPPGFLRKAEASERIRGLAVQVAEQFFLGPDGRSGRYGTFALDDASGTRRFDLRVTDRPRDRARYRLHLAHRRIAPNEKDRALLRLPIPLDPLYYAVRPLRLAGEHGHALFRRLWNSMRAGTGQ
jgi:hypothetical protein